MVSTIDKLEHLKNLVNLAKLKDAESEVVFQINNISWNQYENLLCLLEDSSRIKTKYLQENLVIMSPSSIHEFDKKLLAYF